MKPHGEQLRGLLHGTPHSVHPTAVKVKHCLIHLYNGFEYVTVKVTADQRVHQRAQHTHTCTNQNPQPPPPNPCISIIIIMLPIKP
jgi:hypothetical protein